MKFSLRKKLFVFRGGHLSGREFENASKHFENIVTLRKKLEDAMGVVDKFGTDARSITRTLENIKDPEQVEKALQTENVEKFVERNRQVKN